MRVRKSQRGFTLVELAASTAVGAIALLGTLSAVLMGANISRSAAETRLVARTTASLMDQIRGTGFDALNTDWNDTTHQFSDLVPGAPDGTVRVSITPVDNGSDRWLVQRVELTATWTGQGGEQSMQLATFMSDRLAVSTAVNGGLDTSASSATAPLDGTAQ